MCFDSEFNILHSEFANMFTPKYTIDSDMLNAISEISGIKVIVEHSRVLPLNELELKREALVRMVHTSTSIEGNKLAEHQVQQVLSGQAVNSDNKSILEVKNYQEAVKEVEKLTEGMVELTTDIILKLHQKLMKGLVEPEKLGKYRPGSIYLVDDYGAEGEVVRYEGPDAKKVPELMEEMVEWYKKATEDKLHPIIKASILHLQFVTIHPFTDGNGRLARLLTQLSLYLDGWDFRKIIVLEEFYNKNRADYYDAENIVQGEKYEPGADLTPWLEYFLAGFLIEARKVSKIITSLGFDKVDTDALMYLDPDEVKIMDMLNATTKITSDDVMKLLNIAKRTSQLKLKGLLEKNLIKAQGRARATYYILAK
jgi:Fic family protein